MRAARRVDARRRLLRQVAEINAGGADQRAPPGGAMITIIIILVVLWALGVITKNTLGGVLHILLVVAIIFGLIHVIRGRGL